jgi:hypothetical protein
MPFAACGSPLQEIRMNARHPIALVLAIALLAATAGCGRKDTNQVGTPADTPATGTTSSTMPGTPPASAASN